MTTPEVTLRLKNARGTELMPMDALKINIDISRAQIGVLMASPNTNLQSMAGQVSAKHLVGGEERGQEIYGYLPAPTTPGPRYYLHNPPIHPIDAMVPDPLSEWVHTQTGDRVKVAYSATRAGLRLSAEWPEWAVVCVPPYHIAVVFSIETPEGTQYEWTVLGRFLELFRKVTP